MSFKLTALDARGEPVTLNISTTSLRIFPDRMVIGEELFLRNSDSWMPEDGKSRFAQILVSEVEKPAATPEVKTTSTPVRPIPATAVRK